MNEQTASIGTFEPESLSILPTDYSQTEAFEDVEIPTVLPWRLAIATGSTKRAGHKEVKRMLEAKLLTVVCRQYSLTCINIFSNLQRHQKQIME